VLAGGILIGNLVNVSAAVVMLAEVKLFTKEKKEWFRRDGNKIKHFVSDIYFMCDIEAVLCPCIFYAPYMFSALTNILCEIYSSCSRHIPFYV
jgi:hypothetical protein